MRIGSALTEFRDSECRSCRCAQNTPWEFCSLRNSRASVDRSSRAAPRVSGLSFQDAHLSASTATRLNKLSTFGESFHVNDFQMIFSRKQTPQECKRIAVRYFRRSRVFAHSYLIARSLRYILTIWNYISHHGALITRLDYYSETFPSASTTL